MALSDRKIPILTGINDVPSTTGQANHPNDSLLCAKYNELIDNELTALQTNLNNLTDDVEQVILDIPTTTDNLPEGTNNKYFNGKTTDNLPEGTNNKYFANSLARLAISVTGNGSYNSSTGVINISNANQSVDHISLTNTSGRTKTYTVWGDSAETINLSTFSVTDGLDGTNGTNGQNGQGIDHISSVDNGNGTKTITFWGNLAETINLGSVILASGVDGQDGDDGQDGVDGRGITNTSYNASTGILTLTFSDATTFNTGDLRGANGTNGTNGVSPTVTVLTQAQYTALSPNYDVNTFYVING